MPTFPEVTDILAAHSATQIVGITGVDTTTDELKHGVAPYYRTAQTGEVGTVLRTMTVTDDDEFAAALADLRAGDEIEVACDLTEEHSGIDTPGTAENPIIIRADYPLRRSIAARFTSRDATHLYLVGFNVSGGVVFDGRNGGGNASHCRAVGCRFTAPGVQPMLQLYLGASNFKAILCEFNGTGAERGAIQQYMNAGTAAMRTSNNMIMGCWFHDFGNSIGEINGTDVIQSGQNRVPTNYETSLNVEYCLFERCTLDREIVSFKSSRNSIRRSVFRDCKRINGSGSFVSFRHGSHNEITQCVLINCGGILVWGDYHVIDSCDLYESDIYLGAGSHIQSDLSGLDQSALAFPAARYARVSNCDLHGGTVSVGYVPSNATWYAVDASDNTLIGLRNATVVLDYETSTSQPDGAGWTNSPTTKGRF